jgi:uncharacterized protein YecT (DUF1311 family)
MRERYGNVLRSASMALFLAVLCGTSLALCQPSLEQDESSKILSKISGKWVVSSVAVFYGPSSPPNVINDDPNLMGRYETISPSRIIKFDSEKNVCDHPSVTVKKKAAGVQNSENLSFQDFVPSAQFSNRDKVGVYLLKCTGYSPISGKLTAFTYSGDDMVLLSDGRLMDIYQENIVVFLSRADPNAKPNPSFDCGKAGTPAEVTICKSIELSSYDRAIAKTYKDTMNDIESEKKGNSVLAEGDKDELVALRGLQEAELQNRNKCGDDSKCLLEALHHNAEALVEFVRQSR